MQSLTSTRAPTPYWAGAGGRYSLNSNVPLSRVTDEDNNNGEGEKKDVGMADPAEMTNPAFRDNKSHSASASKRTSDPEWALDTESKLTNQPGQRVVLRLNSSQHMIANSIADGVGS